MTRKKKKKCIANSFVFQSVPLRVWTTGEKVREMLQRREEPQALGQWQHITWSEACHIHGRNCSNWEGFEDLFLSSNSFIISDKFTSLSGFTFQVYSRGMLTASTSQGFYLSMKWGKHWVQNKFSLTGSSHYPGSMGGRESGLWPPRFHTSCATFYFTDSEQVTKSPAASIFLPIKWVC